MGNRFSCICLSTAKNKRNEDNAAEATAAKPQLHMEAVLARLPVNLSLNRLEPQSPTCLLLPEWFLQIQKQIPAHLQNRTLELVFSSWENGFSYAQLRQATSERLSHKASAQELILLIRPSLAQRGGDESGEDSSCSERALVGAFIPGGIDFSIKKYFGTDGTFVFSSMVTGCDEAPAVSPQLLSPLGQRRDDGGVAGSPLLSSDSSPASSPTSLPPLAFFRCSDPKANEYFIRVADTSLSIGGGGKGPAISLDPDMEYVTSSMCCPTFGNGCRCLLPVYGDSSKALCGVEIEGFQAKSPVHTIELWSFSNAVFSFP